MLARRNQAHIVYQTLAAERAPLQNRQRRAVRASTNRRCHDCPQCRRVVMRTLSAQALREAVTAKATSDAAFASELRADPQKAIEARFGKQPYAIKTVQTQPDELPLLVPSKTVALEQVVNRGVADLGSRKPTSGELGAIVAQKAWSDAAFATQLAQDPRAALESVLKPYDVAVPAGKTVRVFFE